MEQNHADDSLSSMLHATAQRIAELKRDVEQLQAAVRSIQDADRAKRRRTRLDLIQSVVNIMCETCEWAAIDFEDPQVVHKMEAEFGLSPDDLRTIRAGCRDGRRRSDRWVSLADAMDAVGESGRLTGFWDRLFAIVYKDEADSSNSESHFFEDC